MRTAHPRRAVLGSLFAVLIALTFTAAGAQAVDTGPATAVWSPHASPVVRIDGGAVRGAALSAVDEFLGLPYAAPPTGALRWRHFACPALQVERSTSRRVPTFAYQFNDDSAPERFAGLPPAAA